MAHIPRSTTLWFGNWKKGNLIGFFENELKLYRLFRNLKDKKYVVMATDFRWRSCLFDIVGSGGVQEGVSWHAYPFIETIIEKPKIRKLILSVKGR